MKNKLFLLTVLIALFTNFANAQSIQQDAASGGQMLYTTTATAIIPDSTSVRVRNMWGFNPNFNPFSATSWDTITNTSALADTIVLNDTVSMPTTGNYFVRWELQVLGDTVSQYSGPMPVTVVPVIVLPQVERNTNTATTTGGIQTLDYHAGFDNAQLKVLLSLGDTSFLNPVLQSGTVQLTDSGTYTYTFSGYPANYVFSYKFILSNTVGSDTTTKGWIKVLPSNALWVGQVDSFGVTHNTISTRTQVICNSSQVLRTYIAYHNQNTPIDSVDQVVNGFGFVIATYANFAGLLPVTGYDVWSTFVGTSTVGVRRFITTTSPIVPFTITTDSVKTVGGNVRVYGTVTVPSGQTASVGAMRTSATDINFDFPIESPPFSSTFSQGLHTFTYDFVNVPAGTPYRYKVYGLCGNDYLDNDAGSILHTFVSAGDTVAPVFTMFDTVSVTTTTVSIVFTATDSVGVISFVVTKNGAWEANLLPSQNSYTFTGLTANTTYTFTIQAYDDAGNPSVLQVITVTTDVAGTSNTTATLTSITYPVCFGSQGWVLIDVYGSNFVSGAMYTADYHDGQPNDEDTVQFVSTSHVKVWIWNNYLYSNVEYTITNPGTNTSNSLVTSVVQCGTTGISEANRSNRNLLMVFPNPVVDVTTVEVAKATEYNIYSLDGSLVQMGYLHLGQNTINLQSLAPGVYLMGTTSNLKTKIVKL